MPKHSSTDSSVADRSRGLGGSPGEQRRPSRHAGGADARQTSGLDYYERPDRPGAQQRQGRAQARVDRYGRPIGRTPKAGAAPRDNTVRLAAGQVPPPPRGSRPTAEPAPSPEPEPVGRKRKKAKKKPPRPTALQVVGELFLTIGLLCFLFVFYEAYWTNVNSGRLQNEAAQGLSDDWENGRVNPRGTVTPQLGEAFARLYIPSFGSDFQFAVLEGTSDEDLLVGPGRYTDTQMPGETGNFAVAGHRVGKGAPFNDLGKLNVCDSIVVETQSSWDTYRVLPIEAGADRQAQAADCFRPEQVERIGSGDYAGVEGRHITVPTDVSVLEPLPGSGTMETNEDLEALITLTTCHPQFSNAERMIIHAVRTEVQPKDPSGALPPAMKPAQSTAQKEVR